jgi:hypothetical protein
MRLRCDALSSCPVTGVSLDICRTDTLLNIQQSYKVSNADVTLCHWLNAFLPFEGSCDLFLFRVKRYDQSNHVCSSRHATPCGLFDYEGEANMIFIKLCNYLREDLRIFYFISVLTVNPASFRYFHQMSSASR